jgi:hypothetical protein
VTVTGNHRGPSFETTADANGTLANVPVKVPTLSELGFTDRWRQTTTIAATDANVAPAAVASAQITVTTWGIQVAPWYRRVPVGHPRRMASFVTFGWAWATGHTLYAHYVLRGRVVHTAPVGFLHAPCGDARTTMREFPFRPVPAGAYTVQFDATRAYHPPSDGIESSYSYYRVRVRPRDAVG